MKTKILIITLVLLLTSCVTPPTQGVPAPVSTDTALANMPNPASVYLRGARI